MSQNDFTKANHRTGIDGQTILDAGLNVFGLQLLIESYTDVAQGRTGTLEFTYLGVDVRLKINHNADQPVDNWLASFVDLAAAATMIGESARQIDHDCIARWRDCGLTPEAAVKKQIDIWEGR